MAVPSVVGTPQTNSGGTATLTLNLPSGIQGSELVLGVFAWGNSNVTFTPPTGWVQVRAISPDTPNLWIGYSKGSPSHTVTNLSGGTRWNWISFRLSGAELVEATFDGTAITAASSNSTTSITAPAITTEGQPRLVIRVYILYGDDTTGLAMDFTPGAGDTQIAAIESPVSSTVRNMFSLITSVEKTTSGAEATKDASITLAGDSQAATLAIVPGGESEQVTLAGDITVERY